jgi:hypothetical protein
MRLHRRQHHRHHVHAAGTDDHQDQGDAQAHHRIGGIDLVPVDVIRVAGTADAAGEVLDGGVSR